MKITLFFAIFHLLLFFPGVDSSQAQGESYGELRNAYQQLITSAQLQRQRSNWVRLIANFDGFIAQRSRDAAIENAYFLRARTWDGLAQASGGRSDAEEAIRLYLDLANRFPDSRFADDALFHAGEIVQQRLNEQDRAVDLYRRVIHDTPTGDMVSEARKKLSSLSVSVQAERVKTAVEQHQYQEIAQAPELESIRYWSGPEYTRIVLDLSAPVVANPNFLKGSSPRLYFDLVYTDLSTQLPDEIVINNGLIQRVRASRFDTRRSRVVIDLERELEYRITTLDNPHRLVVDILGTPSRAPQAQIVRPPSSPPIADDSIADILGSATTQQPVMRIKQQSNGDGIRLIVIDPGHGGRDPGAIGPNGTREKDVNLAMAKIVAVALRQQLGVKVLLTREDDRYLELRERTEYANRVGADLFISLHANATTGSRAYGVETYFLNLSKTDEAAEVAARENGMTLQDISNLEAILFDLMANAKINESSRLAAEVQQSLVTGLSSRYSNIRDLGVKQGPFHVLLGATMPSALVESAFITNPREEKRLNSVDYQRHVANAIIQGIKKYAAAMGQVAWK